MQHPKFCVGEIVDVVSVSRPGLVYWEVEISRMQYDSAVAYWDGTIYTGWAYQFYGQPEMFLECWAQEHQLRKRPDKRVRFDLEALINQKETDSV